ncbi:unnamed protein product [Camellia sinensis]
MNKDAKPQKWELVAPLKGMNNLKFKDQEFGCQLKEVQRIVQLENSGLNVFSFLANSILKEVLSAIQKGKLGAFSPGRPTAFLKNYKSSLDFLGHLEGQKRRLGSVVTVIVASLFTNLIL